MQINAKVSIRECLLSRKGEELPMTMSEEALRGWFWIAVVVLALALWIIPYVR
jgi:hypothetical protein